MSQHGDCPRAPNPPELEVALIGLWLAKSAMECFREWEPDPDVATEELRDMMGFIESFCYGQPYVLSLLIGDLESSLRPLSPAVKQLNELLTQSQPDFHPDVLARVLIRISGESTIDCPAIVTTTEQNRPNVKEISWISSQN